MPKKKKSEAPKIKPMNNRVLIQRDEALEVTDGGIVIPDAAKEKPCWGEILAIASDTGPDVKVGMVVLFPKHGNDDLKVAGEDFVLVDADDLLAFKE